MNKYIIILFALMSCAGFAQKNKTQFTHVEPAFWWTGMKNTQVQILFHSSNDDLKKYKVSLKYPGVEILDVKFTENPHYLFLTLNISQTASAGKVAIKFTSPNSNSFVYHYEIKQKLSDKNRIAGFSSADVLYLLMPDRFANGNTKNDTISGMLQGTHRDQPFGRHGGDIKGISNHLDYIKNLGVTAIWLNPVLENDQLRESYHGYAITDLYQVDRRFGTNEDYIKLVEKSHSMGLKVIQDMIANHIGSNHWLMKDLPAKSWIHQFPEFTRSNYRTGMPTDPYVSQTDLKQMTNGWFDTSMPDVDQTDSLFATYLIQNSIWWIENAGIDGIRMDTYPYPDKYFMTNWARALKEEYPTFNIVGEVWVNSIPMTAYWQKGVKNNDGYVSELPSVTDFPFYSSIAAALNEEGGWDNGLNKIYFLLSQDFIYNRPQDNLIFLDNHDLSRFYLTVGKDFNKFKMGITLLLTTRGIPQLYYGTELLMDGDAGSHPNVRKDFPGGWQGDALNAFTNEGRTKEQNDAFNFMKKLLDWRKTKNVIHNGKLMHYLPEDNVYVYFRYNEKETVMVVINGSKNDKLIKTSRFKERIKNFIKAKNILTGDINDINNIIVPAKTALVFELM